MDAVAFGFGSEENELLNNPIDVVGKLSVNEWNGRKKPQLMVTDFGVNGFQIFDWRSKRYRTLTEFKEDIFYLAFEKNSLKELNKEIREKIILFESLEKTKELIEGKITTHCCSLIVPLISLFWKKSLRLVHLIECIY